HHAIEGETAAALRDALADAQDGRGWVRLGELNLNGSALGNAIIEGDVQLIGTQSNRSVLNTIHIDGDLGELRSSGSLANLFVGGDAGRIDGGIALANVDVEG